MDNNPRFRNNSAGNHIRISYEIYKKGKLKDEYKELRSRYSDDVNYIKEDSRLYDYLNNNYQSIDSLSFNSYKIYNNKAIKDSLKDSFRKFFIKVSKRISRITKVLLVR